MFIKKVTTKTKFNEGQVFYAYGVYITILKIDNKEVHFVQSDKEEIYIYPILDLRNYIVNVDGFIIHDTLKNNKIEYAHSFPFFNLSFLEKSLFAIAVSCQISLFYLIYICQTN